MIILFILVVFDYIANTINTNNCINIINKMMIANVSTKINNCICSVVINSRSKHNTNIRNNINNMIISTSIVNIKMILINLLVRLFILCSVILITSPIIQLILIISSFILS